MIEIAAVRKTYGDFVALDDVSLSLPAGGLTAMIGPNGAGKSTLLSIAARILSMDAGRVSIDGFDVTQTPGEVLARRLAFLQQNNQVTPRLTIAELVAFGRYPYSKGRLTAEDHDKMAEAIAYVGLDDLRHRYLDELSGGQRQRAFVAMVLAQDTDVLLLDEPLNNLDMKHAASLMRLFRRAADDLGKTVVVVLHDINFASAYADRIVAMKEGRIVCHGTPDEIMQSEVLNSVYDMDIAIHQIDGMKLGLFYR